MAKDDFWSVDKLMPRVRSNTGFSNSKGQGVRLKDLAETGEDREKRFGEKIFVPESRVIRHFALYREEERFSFPALTDPAPEAPFVPCDLLMPSFLTLTREQRHYLEYFIRCTREGQKMPCSFAYVKLALCFFLANANGAEMPDAFFFLWSSYRRDFPAAEKLFCDVYSDWCFYQKTLPDFSKHTALLSQGRTPVHPFLYHSYLFDFLFADGRKMTPEEGEFALRCFSGLNFRRSRAYQTNGQYAALSENALSEAIREGVFNRKELNEALFNLQIPAEVRTMRRLFADLPGEHAPHTDICLVYLPLLTEEVIRDRCDAVVRYVENRIRSILRMKNQLGRVNICSVHRDFLEGILTKYQAFAPSKESELAEERKETPLTPRKLEVDPAIARAIEEDSWSVTEKLTAFYETGGEMVSIGQEPDEKFDQAFQKDLAIAQRRPASPGQENPYLEFAGLLTEEEDRFVSIHLYRGADAARNFARSRGQFFEAMLASCNTKAVEATGDAVFDGTGQLFDDYLEELKEIFLPWEEENNE